MKSFSALIVLLVLAAAVSAQTLQNGQFVHPYTYINSNTSVAGSWTAYRLSGNPQIMPSEWEQMPGGPGGQISCQQIWADWASFEAGVYQRVSGAVVNQSYRATGWFMSIYRHGAISIPPDSYQDGSIYQRIGIDPYGGTDPNSPNIVWSWNDPFDRRWRELAVDAVAKSTTITVFARTNNPNVATNCLSFYDAFGLTTSAPVVISNVKVRPGASDVTVSWTTDVPATSSLECGLYQGQSKVPNTASSSALKTSHSMTISGLNPATQYYCIIKSTAPGKTDTRAWGSVFTTMSGQYYPSLEQAKNNPDSTRVFIKDVVASTSSSQLSMAFYVQDLDRSSGIRIYRGLSNITCAAGDIMDVSGTLSTAGGERRLTSPVIAKVGQVTPPRPLAMANACVGGISSDPYTPAVVGGIGPNNSGLLVTVWGRMTNLNSAAKYFYIDDGSGLEDGSLAGRKGIRVSWYNTLGTFNVLPDKYVVVTGLSSAFIDSNGVHPQITIRSPQDLIQF